MNVEPLKTHWPFEKVAMLKPNAFN